jgi:hypothetical protein
MDEIKKGNVDASWALAYHQKYERDAGDIKKMNPTVRQKANLSNMSLVRATRPVKIVSYIWGVGTKRERFRLVRLKPSEISDRQVKMQTGFSSVQHMLLYIAVLVNGDVEKVQERSGSSLTCWFEEWYLFFELVWGRSALRWCDAELKYGLDAKALREIFDLKTNISTVARDSWPPLASFHEDENIRNVGLWAAYKNQRIILWDTTNIPIPQPGDAEGQSLTWNSYYHQNCGKAGIGVQPCGWIRCAELWMGAASNTLYHSKNEGILPMQQEFQESDKIDETIIPFIQILDRGYQVQKASLDAGKQKVEEPFFADKEGFSQLTRCKDLLQLHQNGVAMKGLFGFANCRATSNVALTHALKWIDSVMFGWLGPFK